jgi:hypothetical protein
MEAWMRAAISSCFGFIALLAVSFAAPPVQAAPIPVGTLNPGDSFSDTISSSSDFSQDYQFDLVSTAGLTILASAFGQTSPANGIDNLTINLYDSGSNLLATGSGTPIAFFDSFNQSGVALGAGAYLLTVLGTVTAGHSAFVLVSLAANDVGQVPIPAAGLMLLTGLGAIGGLAVRRRAKANAA